MYTFLSVVYVLVCSFLIMVVLLQQGREAVIDRRTRHGLGTVDAAIDLISALAQIHFHTLP